MYVQYTSSHTQYIVQPDAAVCVCIVHDDDNDTCSYIHVCMYIHEIHDINVFTYSHDTTCAYMYVYIHVYILYIYILSILHTCTKLYSSI